MGYKCDRSRCNKIHTYLADAINHTLFAHARKSARKCPCGFKSGTYQGLKQHICTKHKEEYKKSTPMQNMKKTCMVYACGASYNNGEDLVEHYKKVHNCTPEECIGLIDDGQTHIIPRQCDYCSHASHFTTVQEYWRHIINHHPGRHMAAKIPKSITRDIGQQVRIIQLIYENQPIKHSNVITTTTIGY